MEMAIQEMLSLIQVGESLKVGKSHNQHIGYVFLLFQLNPLYRETSPISLHLQFYLLRVHTILGPHRDSSLRRWPNHEELAIALLSLSRRLRLERSKPRRPFHSSF